MSNEIYLKKNLQKHGLTINSYCITYQHFIIKQHHISHLYFKNELQKAVTF